MKPWPDGNETPYVDELISPLCEALEELYDITLRTPLRTVDYDGFDIGHKEKHICLSPDKVLDPETIKWTLEQHGIQPLESIMHLAFLMGVEQGRRIERQRTVERESTGHPKKRQRLADAKRHSVPVDSENDWSIMDNVMDPCDPSYEGDDGRWF